MKLGYAVFALVVAALISGCSMLSGERGIFIDRTEAYLDATVAKPLNVPAGLSAEAVEDVLVIPEIPEQVRPDYFPRRAPRPMSLFALEEALEVRIQILGDEHWLAVPQPPAVVWSQVKQYFLDAGIEIAHELPAQGLLTTEWIVLDSGVGRDKLRQSLRDAKQDAGVSGGRDRVRLHLEPGLRQNSTEISLRHENDQIGVSDVAMAAFFPRFSSPAAEREMLNSIGEHLLATAGSPAISYVAQGIGARSRASILLDAEGDPVMNLMLPYDRVWSTLRSALNEAGITVDSADREAGAFTLQVRQSDISGADERIFLRRWFFKEPSTVMQLRVSPLEQGYQVKLLEADGRAVARETSQNLLNRLREHAT